MYTQEKHLLLLIVVAFVIVTGMIWYLMPSVVDGVKFLWVEFINTLRY